MATQPDDAHEFPDEEKKSIEAGSEQSSEHNVTTKQRRKSSWWNSQERDPDYRKQDPFANDDGEGSQKFRSLEWWQAGMIMIAETISLGILSLPSVLAAIGLVPGIILIIGLGLLATYTGYVIGQFKNKYPHVHNMADIGEILFEPLGCPAFGREFLGAAQIIFLMFSSGSHILTWTIAFNTMTGHATCTIVWSVIGFILFWLFDLPRTLLKVSWLSVASFISIISAVMVTMIAVGVAPKGNGTAATVQSDFPDAFLSVTNIIFAYAGHLAFPSFISEMKNPKDFPKALILLQVSDITMYTIVAIVVYRYTGQSVDSPALGSSGEVVKKVAYGLALPTIIIAGVIYGHVATKYVFVRLFRGTKHITAKTFFSYGVWAGIAFIFWLIAWIIAESIPVFNDLLSLISSLFAAWFTYGLSGIMWLFLNWGQWTKNSKKMALTGLNIFVFLVGAGICGMGLYASGKAIHDDTGTSAWTCANNGQ